LEREIRENTGQPFTLMPGVVHRFPKNANLLPICGSEAQIAGYLRTARKVDFLCHFGILCLYGKRKQLLKVEFSGALEVGGGAPRWPDGLS
jgi:hypothetical protein